MATSLEFRRVLFRSSHTGLFKQAAWAIAFDYAVENEDPGKFWIEVFTDVTKLIQLAGAEAIPVEVANHDAAVARVSHLPHVLAEALAVVGDNRSEERRVGKEGRSGGWWSEEKRG